MKIRNYEQALYRGIEREKEMDRWIDRQIDRWREREGVGMVFIILCYEIHNNRTSYQLDVKTTGRATEHCLAIVR